MDGWMSISIYVHSEAVAFNVPYAALQRVAALSEVKAEVCQKFSISWLIILLCLCGNSAKIFLIC